MPGTVLLDATGEPVKEVSEFFATMLASGASSSSLRSYGMALLRWWRFLAAVGVPWQRAGRIEARDFVLWMRLVGPSSKQGGYAPATINHALAVVKMFYADRMSAGHGPLINPVPDVDRRAGRRAQATSQSDAAVRIGTTGAAAAEDARADPAAPARSALR